MIGIQIATETLSVLYASEVEAMESDRLKEMECAMYGLSLIHI